MRIRMGVCPWGLRWLLVVVLASVPVPGRSAPTEREIARELVCKCGCGNMPIQDCECSNARKIRAEIRSKISEGLSRRQVLDYFIEKYGEEIVGAPAPWKSFNIIAWVVPFVAIAIGVLVYARWIRQWQGGGARPGSTIPDTASQQVVDAHTSSLANQLDRELKEFD